MRRLTALFLSLALTGPALAQRDRPEIPALTVTGTGEVRVAPDQAMVRLGVTRQASTAETAQEEVNRRANAIIAAILRTGVPREEVQTGQLTLFPIYAPQKPESPEEPRIVAYRASNIVTVRLDKLNLVGPVIDAGLKAGANQLEGVSFTLKNDLPAREEALRQAALEARRKAQTMSQTLDIRLTGIQEVQEGGVGIYPPPVFREAAMAARGGAADSTPVLPGQVTVNATVTIRYRIADR